LAVSLGINFNNLTTSKWKVANNFDYYEEPQVYTDSSNNMYISNRNYVLKVKKESYNFAALNVWAYNKE